MSRKPKRPCAYTGFSMLSEDKKTSVKTRLNTKYIGMATSIN